MIFPHPTLELLKSYWLWGLDFSVNASDFRAALSKFYGLEFLAAVAGASIEFYWLCADFVYIWIDISICIVFGKVAAISVLDLA